MNDTKQHPPEYESWLHVYNTLRWKIEAGAKDFSIKWKVGEEVKEQRFDLDFLKSRCFDEIQQLPKFTLEKSAMILLAIENSYTPIYLTDQDASDLDKWFKEVMRDFNY